MHRLHKNQAREERNCPDPASNRAISPTACDELGSEYCPLPAYYDSRAIDPPPSSNSDSNMVLHLLGKKSWNVYNTQAIEQVKRDEAAAKRREQEEEERLEAQDAAIRTARLRGETPPTFPSPPSRAPEHGPRRSEHSRDTGDGRSREKKRKRVHGEDETDREMRYAREDVEGEGEAQRSRLIVGERDRNAPIHDADGHFQLFVEPDERERRKREAEDSHKRRKKDDAEKQMQNMRFKDATGYSKSDSSSGNPWYTSSTTAPAQPKSLDTVQEKDVWGNEDTGRKERAQVRLSSSDPLAMMNAGAAAVRKHEAEKAAYRKQQKAELDQLKQDQECERRRERGDKKRDDGERGHRRREDGDGKLDSRERSNRERGERERGDRGHRSHRSRHDDKEYADLDRSHYRNRHDHRRHHHGHSGRDEASRQARSRSPRRRSPESRRERDDRRRSRSPRHNSGGSRR